MSGHMPLSEKCEWCGSDALLMSSLIGGEWMHLCSECYSLFIVDSEKEYGPIPGYDGTGEYEGNPNSELSSNLSEDA